MLRPWRLSWPWLYLTFCPLRSKTRHAEFEAREGWHARSIEFGITGKARPDSGATRMSQALKIFYLDDEPALCEAFADMLESPNRKIWTFSSAEGFLNHVQEMQPDVIFLDYRLPGTTGEALAEKLDPGIRRAIVTGDLDPVLGTKALVDKIFCKPFEVPDIEAYLDELAAAKKDTVEP